MMHMCWSVRLCMCKSMEYIEVCVCLSIYVSVHAYTHVRMYEM